MKIIMCTDHAGLELKEQIKKYLLAKNHDILDVGAYTFDGEDSYVFYSKLANKEVIKDLENNIGIYVCGSGVGMSIVANKQKGIRAVDSWNQEIAQKSREHNNANVLCLGARFVTQKEALKIVDKFLSTNFLSGKYKKRVDDIE